MRGKGFWSRTGIGLLLALLLPACGAVGGGGTLSPTIAPAIPLNVTAAAGNRSVTVSWTDTAPGSAYTVKRGLTGGGPYFAIPGPGSFPTPNSYVDSDVQNGTAYYYVVTASNGFGVSSDSSEARAVPGFTPVIVAAGASADHSLAILPDRSVWAWGSNAVGALGIGAFGSASVPTQVVGLTGATAVSCGQYESMILLSDGTIWTFGFNGDGELGLGYASLVEERVPVLVPALTGFVAVAAGTRHCLALNGDGTVWSWGNDGFGQLGNGTVGPTPFPTPAQIPGLTQVRSISAGNNHSLALRNDGSVWAWGSNYYGETGTASASATPVTSPVQVPNLSGIIAIAAGGYFSLALRIDGTVWAWGANDSAQLGNGTTSATPVSIPAAVLGLGTVTAIAGGSSHALALGSDGRVWGWGSNGSGEQGNGAWSNTPTATPVRIAALSDVTAISAGFQYSLALRGNGSLVAWGTNTRGEVGTGTSDTRRIATPIPNLTDVTQVSAGTRFSLARRGDGSVFAWGDNSTGQIGNGAFSTTPVITPQQVITLSGVTAVSAGGAFGLALLGDGTLRAWGSNFAGQMGNGTFSSTPVTSPVAVLNLTGVVAISAGGGHCLAVKGDGTVWAWGSNGPGVLGVPVISQSTTPIQVPGVTGAIAVAAGDSNSYALKSDGTIWAWGWNGLGEMGAGVVSSSIYPPGPVPGLAGVAEISAGTDFGLARIGDVVWGWGNNPWGEVSSSAATTIPTPGPISGLSGVTALAAGFQHSLVLRSDGSVWAWGSNSQGALGTAGLALPGIPAPALTVAGAVSVSSGGAFSLCALADGTVVGWGYNYFNQLGLPFYPQVFLPALITG